MGRILLVLLVALLALPAGAMADADTGGTSAPSGSGGAEFGAPAPRKPASPRRPLVAVRFSVAPSTVVPGTPARVTYRVNGSARRARVRVELVPAGSRTAALRLRLGYKLTNVTHTSKWRLPTGALPAGDYVARLHAVDDAGRTLRRSATASGRRPVHVEVAPVPVETPVSTGLFPVQGPFSFGSDEARFGAQRSGHIHQGQDVLAAEGTPLVTPRAGVVYWRAVQASGAGHYLVIRADDGRDLVFMHLVAGSETVDKGDTVSAGQQIGQVGNTGDSRGSHLHFEIWPDGWYAKDSQPIDPRPDLEAWAAEAGVAPTL